MQYYDLNIDVLLEIFHQYVIMTNDGPFDLILVCTFWRDLVLSTPRLWSYITIDEFCSDYQVKLNVALALSGHVPPTITLVLPLSTLKPFTNRLSRASSLHIHIDDIVNVKPRDETLWDGDEAMEMMIKLLKEADVQYEGPVAWYYSQAPISLSTLRVHDNVNLGNERDLTAEVDVYFCSPYPIFLTLFSMTRIHDTKNLFRHLKAMVNLQTLHLSCDVAPYSYWSEPSTVVLPRLSEILLTDTLRYSSKSKVKTLLGELVQRISAPALEHVGITAAVDSTVHMIHSIYSLNRPSTLTLNIENQAKRSTQELAYSGLAYLRHINIELPISITIENAVLGWLKQNVFPLISTSTICNIIINSGRELPPNAFQELRCPLNIIYTGLHPQQGSQSHAENTVDTVTFRTSGTTHRKDPVPTCRKIRYDSYDHPYDLYTAPNIIHHPDLWPADLEQLASGISSFQSSSLRNVHSTFSRLTTVTCTPGVASVLIRQGLQYILQVLTLVSTGKIDQDEKGLYAVENSLRKRLSSDHTFGSNLAQLNVQYFPPWFKFLKLLNLIVKRRGQALLSVGLPGLPHGFILTTIVSVLNGTPPVTNSAVYKQLVPEAYLNSSSTLPLNCHNCYNSGFKCYRLHEYGTCKRFIDGLKVSITKDTIPV